MKKHFFILIISSFLFQTCVKGPFDELTFIEEVTVVTNQPRLSESSAEVSGSFNIVAGNDIQMEVSARYGIQVGNMPDMSDGQILYEESAELELEPPFRGLSINIPAAFINNIETGQPYFIQAFAQIDGREFTGDIQTFSFRWLPQSSWSSLIPARANPLAFVSGGQVHLIGGNSEVEVFTDIWKYSSITKSAVLTGELPLNFRNRGDLVGFELNGLSYVGLGIDSRGELVDQFWSADLETNPNDWSILSQPFPGGGREGSIAFVVNGKAYVGMGRSFTNFYKDLYEFDENLRQFTLLDVSDNPSLKGRSEAVVFILDGIVYVGLGRSNEGPMNDLWAFDPQQKNWTQKASFPDNGRTGAIALTIGNKAIVGLGISSDAVKNDLFIYDPGRDSWERFGEFPGTARRGAVGFNLQGKGFIGFGIETGSNQAVNDFWEFDIAQ